MIIKKRPGTKRQKEIGEQGEREENRKEEGKRGSREGIITLQTP